MGFFNSGKKNKNISAESDKDSEQVLDMETVNRRWEEAYRANPRAYEKDGQSIIVGFALTEDTDSLFPLLPEKQWAIDGKNIDAWIITMVSLTNPQGGIIGQIEYHEAMKRLAPYIIAVSDNWALIGAMTHDELDGLFEGLPRSVI